jgi:O-succinylbenzoate synthase
MKIEAIHMREVSMPLAHRFETSFGLTTDRRILLVELVCEGVSAWGECVAGEHPYFSDETAGQAAGRHARGHSVRCFHRHPADT